MSPGYRIKKLRDGYKPEKIVQENIMVEKPSETRKINYQIIESRIKECKSAFSGLEKYLHDDTINSSNVGNLSQAVLNAEKKFTALKKLVEEQSYTLDLIDCGIYIENNLSALRGKISSYKISESTPSKIGIVLATALVGGLLGSSGASSCAIGYDGGLETVLIPFFVSSLATGMLSIVILSILEKNPVTYFIQRSHQYPIENIGKYSDLFFDV